MKLGYDKGCQAGKWLVGGLLLRVRKEVIKKCVEAELTLDLCHSRMEAGHIAESVQLRK